MTIQSASVRAYHVLISIEFMFVLFLFAGVYKTASLLQWFPIDITFFFALLTTSGIIFLVLRNELLIPYPTLILSSLFALFGGYAVLTIFWSPSEVYAHSKAFRLITVTGFTLFVAGTVIPSSGKRLRRAGYATVVLALITATEVFRLYSIYGNIELTPFGTNYLLTSRLMGFGVVLLSYYILVERPRSWHSVIAIGLAFFAFAAIVLSGARGPMVATVASIGTIAVVAAHFRMLPVAVSRWFLVAYSVVGSAAVIGIVAIGQQIRGIRRFLALADGPGSSLGTRLDFYDATIANLSSESIVIGHGLGSWPLFLGFPDERRYPHNIILEVLFELGILGFILSILLLGYATIVLFRNWQRDQRPEYIAIFALFVYVLLNAFVTGDLNDNRFLFAVIGLMTYGSHHTTVSSVIVHVFAYRPRFLRT